MRDDLIRCGNTYGEGLVLAEQPRRSSQGGVAPADLNFGGYPLLFHTWLDLEQPNSAW